MDTPDTNDLDGFTLATPEDVAAAQKANDAEADIDYAADRISTVSTQISAGVPPEQAWQRSQQADVDRAARKSRASASAPSVPEGFELASADDVANARRFGNVDSSASSRPDFSGVKDARDDASDAQAAQNESDASIPDEARSPVSSATTGKILQAAKGLNTITPSGLIEAGLTGNGEEAARLSQIALRSGGAGAVRLAGLAAQGMNPTQHIVDSGFGNPDQTEALVHGAAKALEPNVAPSDYAGRAAAFAGNAAPQMLAVMASGGASEDAPMLEKFVAGARAMGLPAVDAAKEAYQRGLANGLSQLDSVKQGLIAGFGTLASGALPIAAPGGAVTRTVSGAVIAGGESEGQRMLANAALPTGRQDMAQAQDTLNTMLAAGMGGTMAGTLGSKPQARTYADLANEYAPPHTEQAVQQFAQQRLDELNAKEAGETRKMREGEPNETTIVTRAGRPLSPIEAQERDFLQEHMDDPEHLATAYNFTMSPPPRGVTRDEIDAARPEPTGYGASETPRADSEKPKAFATRLPMPEEGHLPTDDLGRYFDLSTADQVVPMERLQATKEPDTGNLNSTLKLMAAAGGHLTGRRGPIDVRANADGTYTVLDGNGTFNAAQHLGMSELPVRIVEAAPGLEGWRSPREHLDASNNDTLTSMYAAAHADKPDFDTGMNEIAASVGGEAQLPDLKGRTRAEQKIATDYKGDASRIKDLLRGTIVAPDLASARSVIDSLRKRFNVIDDSKDFLDNDKPTPYAGGYRDTKLIVETPSGAKAEIQVNVPEMVAAKDKAHPIYEEGQRIERDSAGRERTADEETRLRELHAQQEAIYGPAWDSAMSRLNSSSDTLASAPGLNSSETGILRGGPSPKYDSSSPSKNAQGDPSLSNSSAPAGGSGMGVLGDMTSSSYAGSVPHVLGTKQGVDGSITRPDITGQENADANRTDDMAVILGSKGVPVSAGRSYAKGPSAAEALGDHAAAFTPEEAGWKGKAPITVLRHPSEAPFHIDAADHDAAGVYHDGKVFIFADNIKSKAHFDFVVAHEELGHHGLLGSIGNDKLRTTMALVYQTNARVRALAHEWMARNKSSDIHLATEEALANMQGGELRKLSHFSNLISAIKEALRAHFGRKVGFSDNDVVRLLQNARKAVERGDGSSRTPVAAPKLSDGYRAPGAAPLRFHKAFHGSPHDFDQFSLDHIGSGEGAQAYGHGLYFAGNKAIADHYKKTLGEEHPIVGGERANESNPEHVAAIAADHYGGDRKLATDELNNEIGYTFTTKEQRAIYSKAVEILGSGKKLPAVTRNKGRGYEVELAPKEHEYLDWDKPLSEQSPHVREKLEQLGIKGDYTGKEAYEALVRGKANNPENAAKSARASAALHAAGIPGIRYLDGTSRNAGEGSHNYVIFNDKDVKVTGKYSKPDDFEGQKDLFGAERSMAEGAPDPTAPQTEAEARAIATSAFGRFGNSAMRQLEKGGVRLMDNAQAKAETPDLTDAERASVHGYTPDDRSHGAVLYQNVPAKELPGVIVHEVHHLNEGMREDQTPGVTRRLANQIRQNAKTEPALAEALSRVPKDTPADRLDNETIAYAKQAIFKTGLGTKLLDKTMLALNRAGVPMSYLKTNPALLRELVRSDLDSLGRGETAKYNTAAGRTNTPAAAPVVAPTQTEQRPAKPHIKLKSAPNVPRVVDSENGRENPIGSTGMPEVRADAQSARGTSVLPEVSRGLHAPVEISTPPERGTAVQNERAGVRPRVSEAGETGAAAVSGVRGEDVANAPPGLRQAADGRVAMPPVSPEAAPVGVSNASKSAERANRGLGPVEAQGARDFGAVWQRAKDRLAADPRAGDRLVSDINATPRPLSAEETALLVHHGVELSNRYDAALAEVAAATKSGNSHEELNARINLANIEDALQRHDSAARQSGYEQGLGLAMRQALSDRDYSLVRQRARFRAIEQDGKIPAATNQRIEQLTSTVASINAQLGRQRAARAPRPTLDKQFTDLRDSLRALAPKPEPARAFAKDTPNSIIRKMARNRLAAGETDPATIVSQVHDAVKDITGHTPELVRDIISGAIRDAAPPKSALTARMDALKRELRDMAADPDARRNATRQKQLQKQIDDIAERVRTGEYSKEPKPGFKYNDDTFKLEVQRNRAQRQLDDLAFKRQQAQKNPIARIADFAVRLHRFGILSSPMVVPKLLGAVGWKMATAPAETAVAQVLRVIPYIREIAERSPRYGRFDLTAETRAALKGVSLDTLQEAWNQVRHGHDSLDEMYGDKREKTQEWTNFMGNLHSALKEPVVQNEFERSYIMRSNFMQRELAKTMTPEAAAEFMTRDSTKAVLASRAYADAMEAKMQGANVFADAMDNMLRTLRVHGGAPAALEKAIQIVFPIRKVPMNIAAEIVRYGAGGAIGAGYAGKWIRENYNKLDMPDASVNQKIKASIRNLTEDQADFVMKNLTKQGVGGALLMLGYIAGQGIFGGTYQRGDRNKEFEVKPGEANIGGVSVGKEAFHAGPAQVLQAGVALRRLYEADPQGGFDAGLKALGSELFELGKANVPYIGTPFRMADTAHYAEKGRSGAGAIVGSTLRSMLVPQVVQHAAQMQNAGIPLTDAGAWFAPVEGGKFPAAGSIGEDIAAGVPAIPGVNEEEGLMGSGLGADFNRSAVPDERARRHR